MGLHTFSNSSETMFFQERAWLWLFIRVCVILGHERRSPEQHGKNNCYQLNRLCYSFQKADQHCHGQGGRLANTWTQELEALIWSSVEEGTKLWVGKNPMPLKKHSGKTHPGDAAGSGETKSDLCNSVLKNSKDILAIQDSCSKQHHFICEADHFADRSASNGRNEHNLLPRRPKTKTQQKETSGKDHPSDLCYQPALDDRVCTTITKYILKY